MTTAKRIRREAGIRFMRKPIEFDQWQTWLLGHADEDIHGLGWALRFGVRTGRLANHNGRHFTSADGSPLTNGQMADAFGWALDNRDGTDMAATVKALREGLRRVSR